jgi:hypothetical protein
MVLAQVSHVAVLAAYSNRLAGLALLATAAWSWRATRRNDSLREAPNGRSPLWVGLMHGVTGAGALVLLLPNVMSGSVARSSAYLLAFALGSTLVMGILTKVIGKLGTALSVKTIQRLQRMMLASALGLGAAWLSGWAG